MCSVFLNIYNTAEKAVNNQNDVSKLPTSRAYGEDLSPEISVIYLHYSISQYLPSHTDSVKKGGGQQVHFLFYQIQSHNENYAIVFS